MSKGHKRGFPWLVFLVLAACAHAQDSTALRKVLDTEYKGRQFLIRHFYSGSKLEYGPDGSLLHGGDPEPWTLAGVEIRDYRLEGGRLVLNAFRTGLVYDTKAGELRHRRRRKDKASLELSLPADLDADALRQLLARLLISPGEDFSSLLPDYWQSFFKAAGENKDSVKPQAPPGTVSARTKGAMPPQPVHTPDPKYTKAASAARLEGTSVLWVVIGADGIPHEIQIARPLGFGLDEEAIKAVRNWRFKPATKGGSPVAVQVNIEINFRYSAWPPP